MSEAIYFITQTELDKRNQEVANLKAEKSNLQKLLDGAVEVDKIRDIELQNLRAQVRSLNIRNSTLDDSNDWQAARIGELEKALASAVDDLEWVKKDRDNAYHMVQQRDEKLRERPAGMVTETLYHQAVTELRLLLEEVDRWSKTKISPGFQPHVRLQKCAEDRRKWLKNAVPGKFDDKCQEANKLRDEVERQKACTQVNLKRAQMLFNHLEGFYSVVFKWAESMSRSSVNVGTHEERDMIRAMKEVGDALDVAKYNGGVPECTIQTSHAECEKKFKSVQKTNEDLAEKLTKLRAAVERLVRNNKAVGDFLAQRENSREQEMVDKAKAARDQALAELDKLARNA